MPCRPTRCRRESPKVTRKRSGFSIVGSASNAPYAAAPPPPPPPAAPVDLESLRPGQLGGHVTDPSGATVPGAHVTVQNRATGFERTAETDQAGRWVVNDMPAGNAKIKADARRLPMPPRGQCPTIPAVPRCMTWSCR